jgi:hypothetical protein
MAPNSFPSLLFFKGDVPTGRLAVLRRNKLNNGEFANTHIRPVKLVWETGCFIADLIYLLLLIGMSRNAQARLNY